MKKKISDIIPIDYKFNEDELIKDFKEYIDKTYKVITFIFKSLVNFKCYKVIKRSQFNLRLDSNNLLLYFFLKQY